MATKGLMSGVEGQDPLQHIFPTIHPCARPPDNFPHSHPVRELFPLGLRLSLRIQSGSSHSWQEGRSFIQQQCPGGPLCTGPSYHLSKDARTLQSRVSVALHTDQHTATRE